MAAIGPIVFFGYVAYWFVSLFAVRRVAYSPKAESHKYWLTAILVTSLLGIASAIALSLSALPYEYPLLAKLPLLLTLYGFIGPGVVIAGAWWVIRKA